MNMHTVSRDLGALVGANLRTSSRIIAEKFEKNHRDVLRAIRDLVESNPDWGMRNFAQTPYVDAQNGQTYQMYEMTRDGYSLLVMGFTGKKAMDWKIKFLAAFNAMEERLRSERQAATIDLNDPVLLVQLLTEHASKRIEAEQRAAVAEAKADAMQEDVAAHERLTKADGSLNITEAAKNLGIRPKDLFDWLSHNGWIYKRANSQTWLGFQTKCNQGLLEHKTTTVLRADGSEKITEQVRVTPKGLAALAKLVRPVLYVVGERF
ncbi:Rha family transcriptional regulator [Pseudogemmobacter sonorensis]|uniref:Rha family transcriptional regulator n=1 Tax=Pseudogemmobacter sonorensis TaxID=2989681 RepID=UPI0036B539F4